MKLYIAINRSHKGKMPADMTAEQSKEWWNKFNGGFTNQIVEVGELIQVIKDGHAYTTQHNRYRKAENFTAGQHLCLDMDTEDERSTFEYLLQDSFISQFASFLYTTPSHTPLKPRCRVVFVLDKAIANTAKFTLLAESLVYRYGLADTKCKDCCRLFFGSEGCQVKELDNVLTLEDAAKELVEPYKAFLKKQQQEHEERLKTVQVVSAGGVPEKILEAHSQTLLNKVQYAADGEKYGVLRDISRTFGGYVGGGYYNRLDVETWLRAAIGANSNNVKNLEHAYQTIKQGLDYGASEPLYFEIQKPSIETVHPPLTPEQKEQVKVIIADIIEKEYWRGYHDGMTQEQRQKWQDLGFPDYILDMYNLGYVGVNRETGEILNALTIPFRSPSGEITNIEYRPDSGTINYEYDLLPPLFFTDVQQSVNVLVDDSLTALTTYLHYGTAELNREPVGIVGLPFATLTPESLEPLGDSRIIIAVSPDFDLSGRGLKHIKDRARFLRLPQPVNELIGRGIKVDDFSWLLRQAKVVA